MASLKRMSLYRQDTVKLSKQTVQEKAAAYLSEGKVKAVIAFEVEGSAPSPYSVTFSPNVGWLCNCPAYIECAHIVACKQITGLQVKKENLSLGDPNDDILADI